MPGKQQKTVKGEILTAQYDPELGFLSILVRTPDGKARNTVIRKDILTLHGKPVSELPKEEVDAQMEKMADGFRKAKGRMIGCTLYEDQF